MGTAQTSDIRSHILAKNGVFLGQKWVFLGCFWGKM